MKYKIILPILMVFTISTPTFSFSPESCSSRIDSITGKFTWPYGFDSRTIIKQCAFQTFRFGREEKINKVIHDSVYAEKFAKKALRRIKRNC